MATIVLAAGMIMASAPPLYAEIMRGCSASLYVKASGAVMTLASIEGRGVCKNKVQANDCRVSAHKKIEICLKSLWRVRQKNEMPFECSSIGGSREGAKLTWDGIYPIAEPNRLSARMAYAACCKLKPNSTQLQLITASKYSGDSGCGAPGTFEYPKYDMNCEAWRSQGLCN
jgi:hypothetical protein